MYMYMLKCVCACVIYVEIHIDISYSICICDLHRRLKSSAAEMLQFIPKVMLHLLMSLLVNSPCLQMVCWLESVTLVG